MSGLIKSGTDGIARRVRPFALVRAEVLPAPDPELVALREQCLALEVALAEREEAITAVAEKAEAAWQDGEAAGREAGRAEADERRADALALLEDASDRACAELAERLQGMDGLAALLARTCLDRLFGDPGARADIVRDLIRHQVDSLRGEAVVEIRVSAEDFPTDTAIEGSAGIVVSDALASGDCAIRLRLGTLEAGLDQQWGGLRSALSAMAGEEAP
jgi:type III secretion protein L